MRSLTLLINLSFNVLSAGNGSWIPTGGLHLPREHHTATLLTDGRVLVVGGHGREAAFNADWEAGPYSSAEIYDPATGMWSRAGNLGIARYLHSATLLPTGQVLVAGGAGAGFGEPRLRSAEL